MSRTYGEGGSMHQAMTPPGAVRLAMQLEERSNSATPRVFLVDDNDGLRAVIRDLLEDVGIQVVGEGSDGTTAMRLISLAAQAGPLVALMDVRMPGAHNGLDVTRHLMAMGVDVEVIVFTGFPDEAIEQAAKEAGAFAFLVKGATGSEVVAVVQDAWAAASGQGRSGGGMETVHDPQTRLDDVRVLVGDATEGRRKDTADLLQHAGASVTTVGTLEGLTAAALSTQPSVVVTADVYENGMTALSAIKVIRNQKHPPTVVVTSAIDDRPLCRALLAHGAYRVLVEGIHTAADLLDEVVEAHRFYLARQ